MYKLHNSPFTGQEADTIIRLCDGIYFPKNPDNTDYQAYLKWLEESPDNIPHSADGTTNLTPLNREAE